MVALRSSPRPRAVVNAIRYIYDEPFPLYERPSMCRGQGFHKALFVAFEVTLPPSLFVCRHESRSHARERRVSRLYCRWIQRGQMFLRHALPKMVPVEFAEVQKMAANEFKQPTHAS